MKILHLADLHLGKVLQEQSLIEDQKYMLDKIIEIIEKEKIEVVFMAGDIYDKSIPSTDAVNLLDDFLNKLIKMLKVKVCIIAGNHDSKERLGFGNKIFENDGLYIASKYNGNIKKVELQDEYGKLNVYMLPFIKPAETRQYFEEEIKTYEDAIKRVIENEEINENERNIIIVHQFVTAGGVSPERTESEVLSLGGTDNVDVSNFDKFDYVAIGHVHKPQRIGRDTARYAGTMLKYSFSEVNHKKTVPIIDFRGKENLKFELKELIPLRDMREIQGPLEELISKENYEGTNREDYIKAIITNEEPIYDAIGQIKKVYPNTLKLEIKNNRTSSNQEFNQADLENLKRKSELELFDDFYKMQNNENLNKEKKEMMEKIIDKVKEE